MKSRATGVVDFAALLGGRYGELYIKLIKLLDLCIRHSTGHRLIVLYAIGMQRFRRAPGADLQEHRSAPKKVSIRLGGLPAVRAGHLKSES